MSMVTDLVLKQSLEKVVTILGLMELCSPWILHLFHVIALAALVWMISRHDLQATMKRIVVLVLAFCVFHVFIYQ